MVPDSHGDEAKITSKVWTTFTSGPESGLDCLTCAEFARQRGGTSSGARPERPGAESLARLVPLARDQASLSLALQARRVRDLLRAWPGLEPDSQREDAAHHNLNGFKDVCT